MGLAQPYWTGHQGSQECEAGQVLPSSKSAGYTLKDCTLSSRIAGELVLVSTLLPGGRRNWNELLSLSPSQRPSDPSDPLVVGVMLTVESVRVYFVTYYAWL